MSFVAVVIVAAIRRVARPRLQAIKSPIQLTIRLTCLYSN